MRGAAASDDPAAPSRPAAGGREANVSISPHPVNRFRPGAPCAAGGAARDGAVVEFLGVVRGEERGEPIGGIEYSAYLPMAEEELARIAAEGQERFGRHAVRVHHVTGFVPAGEASLLVRVAASHSAEGFEACRWYVGEIKRRLPVWKRPVYLGEGRGRLRDPVGVEGDEVCQGGGPGCGVSPQGGEAGRSGETPEPRAGRPEAALGQG